jgi:hypothetical protein
MIVYCLSHVVGGRPMLAFACGSTQLFLLFQKINSVPRSISGPNLVFTIAAA